MEWYLLSIYAAILTAAAVIVQKKTLLKEHAMEFAAVVAILNAVLTAPFLFFVEWNSIPLKAFGFIYIVSLLGSIAYLHIAKAVRHMEVSDASPLMVTGPAVTALLAFLILKETLTLMQVGGIALLIAGAYFLETRLHEDVFMPFKRMFRSKYIRYIFISLFFYGFCSVLDRLIVGPMGIDTFSYIAIVHVFIVVNYFIMIHIFHDGFTGIKHGFKNAWKWLCVVAILTTGYRLLQIQAIAIAKVGLVIAIKRTSALFATIIGGEIFHEKRLVQKSIACAIMVAGAILVII